LSRHPTRYIKQVRKAGEDKITVMAIGGISAFQGCEEKVIDGSIVVLVKLGPNLGKHAQLNFDLSFGLKPLLQRSCSL
jgi:hypothetical protein